VKRRDLFKFLFGLGLGVAAAETYERLHNIPALEKAFRKEIEYWLSQYLDAKRKTEELSSRLKTKEEEIDALHRDVSYWKSQYNSIQDEVNKLNTKVGELSSKLNEANEKIYSLEKELDDWKSKYESTREEANRLKSIIGSMDELEGESLDAISYYREKMNEAINNLKRTIEKYRGVLGDDRVAFESSTVKILEDLKLAQEKLQKVLPYFPLILNFAWKPTKVINDKIYDINVSFEVASPLNSLREVEVMLIPVEYRYFITKYGMREEDYHKVFPKEEVRSIKIKPRNLEREMFSVDFEDLKGGREYIIKARVEDVASGEKVVEMKTPYIRQFENFGKELYDKGIIVSAIYEPWDMKNVPTKDDEPLLGRYSPVDDIVQWKHVDWANGQGINVFYVDGGFWEESKLNGMEGKVIKALMDKGMKCCVVWGWLWEVYFKRGSNDVNLPDWVVDLSDEYNEKQFMKVLTPLINSELLNHYNYHKINSRPVIHINDAIALINEGKAIENVRSYIKKIKGIDIFLVGSVIFNIPLRPDDPYVSYFLSKKNIESYDALTGSVGFMNNMDSRYALNYDKEYEQHLHSWYEFTRLKNKKFIPTIIPGFDNSYSWGPKNQTPIDRNSTLFQKRLISALKYSNYIRIDTWNDFGEWSYIEPTIKEEFIYLLVLGDTLKNSFE
jgi:outer membrane murein-binding lipoprotein Lpp